MKANLINGTKSTSRMIIRDVAYYDRMILINCTGSLKRPAGRPWKRIPKAAWKAPNPVSGGTGWMVILQTEGIKADLEWMHRVGIAGFQNFDASLNTPQIVKDRLVYMTPHGRKPSCNTTKKADSLGLEMAIAGSPGWSESAVHGYHHRKLWKNMSGVKYGLKSGHPFSGVFPHPPSATGSFQKHCSKKWQYLKASVWILRWCCCCRL